jgi:ATP-dependent helicase HrpA
MALPGAVEVRDRTVALHYEVEEAADGALTGVVRLQLPEKLARTLVEEELPALDRPVRFAVSRGARGSARGDTLAEVQEALERPWTPEEARDSRGPRDRDRDRDRGRDRRGRDDDRPRPRAGGRADGRRRRKRR